MPQPGYEGFATLGDAVMGGPGARAEKEFLPRLKQNYDAFGALEQARKQRSQAIAAGMMTDNRGKLTPELVGRARAGDETALSELGAVTMGMAPGQPNLKGLGDLADTSIDQQRQQALTDNDIPQYNRLTALRGDKAYQPARVVQGNILPDGLTLGDEGFDVEPLPQTAATIAQKGAAIGQGERRTQAYVDKTGRDPVVKPSPIARRAATMEEDLAVIEAEIGRPLTKIERADYLQGKAIKLAPTSALGDPAPVAVGAADATATLPRMGPRTKATRAWSDAEVGQALNDARRAVATGRITKEVARQRLLDAGLTNAAGRL